MKKFNYVFSAALCVLCLCCSRDLKEASFDGNSSVSLDTKSFLVSAMEAGFPASDVNSFTLNITDPSGTVYEGPLSESPDTVTVKAGKCSFRIQSREYAGPLKDNPVYGDYLEKELAAGDFFAVELSCRQLTCGVQVSFSADFKEEYPAAYVRIMRRDTLDGSVDLVDYLQNESGYYHFMPGNVTINLMKDSDSAPELLTGRLCSGADMLSVNVSLAPVDAYGTVKVVADTVLNRYNDKYDYGRTRTGKTVYDAVNVENAKSFQGDTVWVFGYITGCYVNKKFHAGIDYTTVAANIALSSASDAESEGTVTIPVSVSSGVCKELNLKEYPAMLGERVAVYGVPGTFYEQDGIKKTLDYVLL